MVTKYEFILLFESKKLKNHNLLSKIININSVKNGHFFEMRLTYWTMPAALEETGTSKSKANLQNASILKSVQILVFFLP